MPWPPAGGKTVVVENPLDVERPAETGSVKWADLDPADAPAATATDALGCEYLFPSAGRTSLGYWAGATWSGAGAVKDTKAWHALVRDFATALRNPIKVSIR